MKQIHPLPEFTALTEDEVRAGFADPNPHNPISLELSRLIHSYTGNFSKQVRQLGYIPETILTFRPSCPIEAVAMRLTISVLHSILANRSAP